MSKLEPKGIILTYNPADSPVVNNKQLFSLPVDILPYDTDREWVLQAQRAAERPAHFIVLKLIDGESREFHLDTVEGLRYELDLMRNQK